MLGLEKVSNTCCVNSVFIYLNISKGQTKDCLTKEQNKNLKSLRALTT